MSENRTAQTISPAKSIVFVLGSTRSGTSAIRHAIAATRYRGAGEGHVTGLVGKLHDAVAAYYAAHRPALVQGTLLARIPEDDWHDRINASFRDLIEKHSPESFIIYKTPTVEPLYALEHIQAMWPDAKFIYCRRRGIDNVMSKQRKWPDRPFENHCQEWATVNDVWDRKKKDLHARWIEIDFFNLIGDVREVTGQIGSLLALTEGETELMRGRLAATRREAPSCAMRGFVPLSETGWSKQQAQLFTSICGATMARCGYGYSGYWQPLDSP